MLVSAAADRIAPNFTRSTVKQKDRENDLSREKLVSPKTRKGYIEIFHLEVVVVVHSFVARDCQSFLTSFRNDDEKQNNDSKASHTIISSFSYVL